MDESNEDTNAVDKIQEKETRVVVGSEALRIKWNGKTGPAPGNRTYIIDEDNIKNRPYLCTYKWKKSFDPFNTWSVTPNDTECHILVQYDDNPTEDELNMFIDQGFIIGSYGGIAEEVDKLILSLQQVEADE